MFAAGIIMIIMFILTWVYKLNHSSARLLDDEEVASPGYYSDSDNYQNLTPMKHDIFKQLTIDIVLAIALFIFFKLIGQKMQDYDYSDFISFNNFSQFRLSIIGQSFLTAIGYVIYYQIVQPYFANYFPKF